MSSCPFCDQTRNTYLLNNDLGFVIFDSYPVSNGHLLIIPWRHVSDFFELSQAELLALTDLLFQSKKYLDDHYSPQGYNIGINCGASAGQTIMHVHIHLIPRYAGDVEVPMGGVRNVIPGKGVYQIHR